MLRWSSASPAINERQVLLCSSPLCCLSHACLLCCGAIVDACCGPVVSSSFATALPASRGCQVKGPPCRRGPQVRGPPSAGVLSARSCWLAGGGIFVKKSIKEGTDEDGSALIAKRAWEQVRMCSGWGPGWSSRGIAAGQCPAATAGIRGMLCMLRLQLAAGSKGMGDHCGEAGAPSRGGTPTCPTLLFTPR